jgi:signal transduction histidine kinase
VSSKVASLEVESHTFVRTLTDITCVLAFAEQAEARIQRALELLGDMVPLEHGAVLIEAPPRGQLFSVAPASYPGADRLRKRMHRLFETVSECPGQSAGAEPILLSDKHVGASWSLAVPLVTVDAIVGILHVGRDTEEYTVHELRLLAIVASQFAAYARGLQFIDHAHLARARAEEANRAKDRFLATVSHELRTPLNVVQGWLQMLRSGPGTEAATDKAITVIERNVAFQIQLVDQLLDAARIATGKFPMELQSLEILPVVSATIDGVRPSAVLKGIELEYIVTSPGDWRVEGDPARLQQAFSNILVNAVKFTPSGGHVLVQVKQDGHHVALEFRDTGIGIAAEHLPKLFDVLWQADALTQPDSGLGLGLSIVRHIVEAHGGEVRAASDGPGQGATITVRLPLDNH